MTRLTRRRFLTLTASTVAGPAVSLPLNKTTRWSGVAMGAEVTLDFHNTFGANRDDVSAVVSVLRATEERFSLFDQRSELSQLNNQKTLTVGHDFLTLYMISKDVYGATDGLFDPSIQTMWDALAAGDSVKRARRHVGFDKVKMNDSTLSLGANQSLSFNGIAQGYATDLIRAELVARGYNHVLINMGEFSAQGGPFALGIQDPVYGQLGAISLKNMSIATSSPSASTIREHDHILHPKGGQTLWSTVSVEAKSAAIADACSTAFCMMSRSQMLAVKHQFGLGRVLLVDLNGNMSTL